VKNLAVLGGRPLFQKPLHVGRPNIGNKARFLKRMRNILENRWLTNNGPYVQDLERRIAKMTGARHCIAVCNATVAMQIAVRALDLKGEVIIPSFTFVATAHALQWEEITPVFCDIDPATFTMDPRAVQNCITSKTTGIIGVHLWGRPCKIDALTKIARHHSLRLIFDAAHSFGCSYGGKMLGRFGDAEVFSFHGTKFFNTFEGGAITTNDDRLAEKVRLMKNFGFAGYDRVVYLGTNGKMTEACAAMGLTNLEDLDKFIEINRRNYNEYQKRLAGIRGISLLPCPEKDRNNYQYVVLLIDPARTHIGRDGVLEALHAENVLARRYFYPGCHRMEPYRSMPRYKKLSLPVTEWACDRVLCLPTGEAVDRSTVRKISDLVRTIVENSKTISSRLNKKNRKSYS